MQRKLLSSILYAAVLLSIVSVTLVSGASAQGQFKILHSFAGWADASDPQANLIFDAAGNLYGTSVSGGPGDGTVFSLSPNSDGTWTESLLYSFTCGADGCNPHASLTLDSAGNLYGTTAGGASTNCNYGCGTVFELTPNSDGSWTESTLHQFQSGTDGGAPWAGLIFDSAGNLYGTTNTGGRYRVGTVFQLKP